MHPRRRHLPIAMLFLEIWTTQSVFSNGQLGCRPKEIISRCPLSRVGSSSCDRGLWVGEGQRCPNFRKQHCNMKVTTTWMQCCFSEIWTPLRGRRFISPPTMATTTTTTATTSVSDKGDGDEVYLHIINFSYSTSIVDNGQDHN